MGQPLLSRPGGGLPGRVAQRLLPALLSRPGGGGLRLASREDGARPLLSRPGGGLPIQRLHAGPRVLLSRPGGGLSSNVKDRSIELIPESTFLQPYKKVKYSSVIFVLVTGDSLSRSILPKASNKTVYKAMKNNQGAQEPLTSLRQTIRQERPEDPKDKLFFGCLFREFN